MPDDNIIKKLETALQAIQIYSNSSFAWFGKREPSLPPRLVRALPPEVIRDYLVNTIRNKLYTDFYCQGQVTPVSPGDKPPVLGSANAAFVAELSNANRGKGYWEEGWGVRFVRDGHVVVQRHELSFAVAQKDCRTSLGQPVETGMTVSIYKPKELKAASPGFYVAVGDEALYQANNSNLVRLYWNLGPDGAIRFMEVVTSEFNQARLPFRLKVINQPARFSRCDTVVLYLSEHDYRGARDMLENIHPQFTQFLRNGTPVFTKAVSSGIGVAEDPLPGNSFGLHRCQILAEAILRAHEQGKKSLPDRLQTIIDAFHEQQISVNKPYLNPGSEDHYDFSPRADQSGRSKNNQIGVASGELGRGLFLDTALEIGILLTRRAIWHEDRCNWLGLDLYSSNTDATRNSDLAYRALGPELYSGTSGIALFLAELQAAVGDERIRQASIGAIRQALSQAPRLLAAGHLGLYDGAVGIAFVATYIGLILGEDGLQQMAAGLLRDAMEGIQQNSHSDLISGDAGTIIALLILEAISERSPRDLVVLLGDELVRKAERQQNFSYWKSPGFPKQQPLTGFSHGAAGIGYALLELFRATGNPRYRDSAEMAFNYERACFNEEMNNWPDFRGVPARNKWIRRHQNFSVSWCHGAPGIALSRLRSYEILHDNRYKSEALAALSTTKAWTQDMLGVEAVNFCLCHGLAGNAHILVKGSHTLGQDFNGGDELAKEVAAVGVEKYVRHNHQWPFGALGDRSPGLMSGLSGVGYFYLSLSNPALPSFLLLEAEKIRCRLNGLSSRPAEEQRFEVALSSQG